MLWNKWRLVKGKELYDLAADPGQQEDVAAEHPDVVKRMRDHYDNWWAGVEPELQTSVRSASAPTRRTRCGCRRSTGPTSIATTCTTCGAAGM